MPKLALHMGFLNTPYSDAAKSAPMSYAKMHENRRRRHYSKTMTADKVASILEAKYQVVQDFTQVHENDIKDFLDGAIREVAIDCLKKRVKFRSEKIVELMRPRTSQVDKLFRSYLDNEETGTSVKAALQGKRTGRKSRAPRPPFVNTGLYRASFRSWVDIE